MRVPLNLGPSNVNPRWLTAGLATIAVGVPACGGDDDAGTSGNRPRPPATRQKIVIKVHADLQEIVDRGEVLSGSLLGDAPFCPRGTFAGSHASGGTIERTFTCPDGNLTIGFTPGKESGRTVTGRWKLLSGTGAFKGMKGFGTMKTRFAADDTEARETFTGSVTN